MTTYSFISKFSPVIEKYMAFRTAVGYSAYHGKMLRRFDRYCFEFHPNADCLTKDVVKGWFDYEIAHGYTGLDQKSAAIRSFAKFVGGDAYMLPVDLIPKRSHFTPYILTDDELYRLFTAIDCFHKDDDPFLSKTLSVLFRLIYACGLRPNEGRNLQTSHIDFDSGELFITKTKRRKERIIVASDEMTDLLRKYKIARDVISSKDGHFFVRGNGEPLTAWYVTRYFKECWAAANPGISTQELPRLRVYDLRHRFASAVLQQWLDENKNLYTMLPYLRSYMGHVRFEDTAYYIHVLPDRLVKSPGINWEAIDKTGLEEALWEH